MKLLPDIHISSGGKTVKSIGEYVIKYGYTPYLESKLGGKYEIRCRIACKSPGPGVGCTA